MFYVLVKSYRKKIKKKKSKTGRITSVIKLLTTINLKHQPQLGLINLICLMDHVQSQIFKITLSMLLKNMRL